MYNNIDNYVRGRPESSHPLKSANGSWDIKSYVNIKIQDSRKMWGYISIELNHRENERGNLSELFFDISEMIYFSFLTQSIMEAM